MDRVGPGLAWHRGGTFTSQCTRADVAQHALDMFVENHLTCITITEHRCAVAGEVGPTGSHSRKNKECICGFSIRTGSFRIHAQTLMGRTSLDRLQSCSSVVGLANHVDSQERDHAIAASTKSATHANTCRPEKARWAFARVCMDSV